MAFYKIEMTTTATVAEVAATLFRVGFGDPPASTDVVVRAAAKRMAEIEAAQPELGGQIALVNGPAAQPVAMLIAHRLVHRFAVVACFDPRCAGYIVAVSHGDAYHPGDMIPAADVKMT